MSKKYTRIYSLSFVIKEIQIKTQREITSHSLEWQKFNSWIIPGVGKDMEQLELYTQQLVEVYYGTITLPKGLAVSQKVKYIPHGPSIQVCAQRSQNKHSHKDSHKNGHSCFVYNSQKLTIQTSFFRRVDRQTVVYLFS